jgi:hypothetical protein
MVMVAFVSRLTEFLHRSIWAILVGLFLIGCVSLGLFFGQSGNNQVFATANVPCTNSYLPQNHDCTAQAILVAPSTTDGSCALVGLQLTEPSSLSNNVILAVNAEVFRGSLVAGQTAGVVFVDQQPAALVWNGVVGTVTYLPNQTCPSPTTVVVVP